MADETVREPAKASRWLAERSWFRDHRHELANIASELYPDHTRVPGTRLLSRPSWLPERPMDLGCLQLVWDDSNPPVAVNGTESETLGVRPVDPYGVAYPSYSDAMNALARPDVFDNRWVYRLIDADLTGKPQLTFCRGRYFDSINVGEATGHELAARRRDANVASLNELPLRAAVGDPCALARRSAALAVTTLTIRHDRRARRASCVLHWRDPAKVAHAGGLYQVLPVGVFQPALDTVESERRDLDLWKSVAREYAEEFLGEPEAHDRPTDYDTWSTYRSLTKARSAGDARIYCLGLGVDPVTFATDLLAVAIFESGEYDRLLGDLDDVNAEGRIEASTSFELEALRPLLAGEVPIQPAGQAVLALAWRHRETLLEA